MSVLFDCCGWEGPSWMQLQRQTRAVLPVMQSRGMYLVAPGQRSDCLHRASPC